jgi:hypothetical protein
MPARARDDKETEARKQRQEPQGGLVMRALASIALLGTLALPALAADLPEWAYPVNTGPKPPDPV